MVKLSLWCLWLLSTLLGIESLLQENQTTTFSKQLVIDEQLTTEYTLVVILHWLHMTDDKLETYWQAVLDDIINSAEFDEFDCSLQTYNDAIEYMIIEGKIQ